MKKKPNAQDYDFAGWVTRHDILCSDGVVIKQSAFADHKEKKVPLVWNHNHKDASAVIGNVILHSREEGVYGYGSFNNTPEGIRAKELVRHGDVASMSIAANQIKKAPNRRDVIHGNIYEVSLVLSGANPGAMIETVIQHSEEDGECAIIYTDLLLHSAVYDDDEIQEEPETEIEQADKETGSDNPEALAKEIAGALTDDELKLVYKKAKELAGPNVPDDKLMEALNEKAQGQLTEYIIELLGSDSEGTAKEDTDVKHNVFDQQNTQQADVIQHSALMNDILSYAKTNGSLKAAMQHYNLNVTVEDLMHGVTEYPEDTIMHSTLLAPEELIKVETFDGEPSMIKPEDDEVVNAILSGVTTTPKMTVRSRFIDMTTKQARAAGYITGDQKIEEFLGSMQRITHPQTIYKYQTLENDELIDIDWNIVAFYKKEAKIMWRYELARAIVIGDGRAVGDRQRIKPENIRPIINDDPFYVTQVTGVTVGNFIDKSVEAVAVDYKGTGSPIMLVDKMFLARVKLQKAADGHYLFGNLPASDSTIADVIGVERIIKPDFLLGTGKAIILNLRDYELAAPEKGRGQQYEDFDLKFNLHEYLMEGRCAGALVKPKSAVVLNGEVLLTSEYTEAADVTADNFASGTYYTRFGHTYNLATEFKPHTTYYTKN